MAKKHRWFELDVKGAAIQASGIVRQQREVSASVRWSCPHGDHLFFLLVLCPYGGEGLQQLKSRRLESGLQIHVMNDYLHKLHLLTCCMALLQK